VRVEGGGGWGIVRFRHDGSLGCESVQIWQVRGGTGRILLCFEFNFCFKAVAHWERIMLLLDSRRFKDGRWQL